MSLINRIAASRYAVPSLFANDPFFRDPFFASPFALSSRHLDFDSANLANVPALDLSETETSYVVTANVPGFTKDQLEITHEGNTVSIKGTWKTESKSNEDTATTESTSAKSENYLHRERSEGSFLRSFTIPDGSIDGSLISAKLSDGVLKVTLPKQQADEKQTKIPIN